MGPRLSALPPPSPLAPAPPGPGPPCLQASFKLPVTDIGAAWFSYSDELGKWMEVGNSGMFRPEMLRPMGLPEDVSVIAWGLSLER